MAESATMESIRMAALDRIEKLADASAHLDHTVSDIKSAKEQIESAWEGFSFAIAGNKPVGMSSLLYFVSMEQEKLHLDILRTCEQAAFLVARDVIAPVARESSVAVAALTSNRYMPPIRSLEDCERIWIADSIVAGEGVWEHFIECLERKLDEEGIHMESPEYDNSLYVVDLRRWEFVEDGDTDLMHGDGNLNDNWKEKQDA